MTLPNLIIIGVFKGATTSLFNYLSKHPDIEGGSKKEIHYFTPLVYNTSNVLDPVEKYASYFSSNRAKYRLEASPAYVYGGKKVINEMEKVLGNDHKVILLLRNPTDRFISYYKFIKSKLLIDDEFELFIDKCFKKHKELSEFEVGHYSNAIKEGLYADYIEEWIEAYGENFQVVFFDDLKTDAKSVLKNISRWLDIDENVYEDLSLSVENQTITPKNIMLHRLFLFFNRNFGETLSKIHPIKNVIRSVYRNVNSSKQRESLPKDEVYRLLSFYKEPNIKLKKILPNVPNSWVKID